MKQPAETDSKEAQNVASAPARTARSHHTPTPGGYLGQLAAMMNSGPRVQGLAQLKEDLQQKGQVQSWARLTAGLNQGEPAQLSAAAATTSMPKTAPMPAQRKNGKGKAAPQEDKWKKAIIDKGFTEGQVKVGGAGSANADISAQDLMNLWLFEVKGANQWKSAENFAHEGNVPAKQLSGKLFGKLKQKMKIKTAGGEVEEVTLEEALANPDYYVGVREQLLLGVSNISEGENPLLALQINTSEEEEEAGFDKTKGAALPLDLADIFNYLTKGVEFVVRKNEDDYASQKRAVEEIEEEWGEWAGDARSFFVQNPEHLGTIEKAYTFARQKGSKHKPHTEELATLGEDIEFRFIPVVRDLTKASKVEPVQGVFVHKKTTYNETNAGDALKIKIHGVKPADLERLARSDTDLGTISNADDVQAALEKIGGEEQKKKEPSPAEKHKEEQIAPYLVLIDHLAGEGGGNKDAELKGGHLLTEMKAKYPNLRISGTPSQDAPWEGWWTDGVSAPKWSSFFPSNWTKDDLVGQLKKSSLLRQQLYLPGGIAITKSGETFYPWVNKTLPKPEIKDMVVPS